MYVLAFDVSMGHSYHVIYQDGRCLTESAIEHNQEGFSTVLNEINALPEVPEIVFEATGVYSRVVEKFCVNNHFDYYLLNPLEAKKQLEENTLRSWKTDKSDAHRLALTHFEKKQVRRKKITQSSKYNSTHDLARFYQEINEKILKTQMNLHNALHLTFPELTQLFSKRLTPYSLTLIELFPHPDDVLENSRTVIKNLISKNTLKKISVNRAWNKADTMIRLAKISYPAVDRESIQCQKVIYYAKELQKLLMKKEELSLQLIDSAKQFHEFNGYKSIPGIGELTAALLIGELGDFSRFSSAKQINAYVGIDIRRYQSGKYTGQDHINKRGNPRARMILFFIIKTMIRVQRVAPNHLVDYYYKLKKQPIPKKEKVAVVACMNKLLKCLYAINLKHTVYDYTYAVSVGHS